MEAFIDGFESGLIIGLQRPEVYCAIDIFKGFQELLRVIAKRFSAPVEPGPAIIEDTLQSIIKSLPGPIPGLDRYHP